MHTERVHQPVTMHMPSLCKPSIIKVAVESYLLSKAKPHLVKVFSKIQLQPAYNYYTSIIDFGISQEVITLQALKFNKSCTSGLQFPAYYYNRLWR